MLRWVLGALGASVLMFFWGFVFWGLLGGAGSIHDLPNESAVRDALRAGNLATGTYYLPRMVPEAMPDVLAGPLVKIYYHAEGGPPMSPGRMGTGFLQLLVAALLAGWLLGLASGTLRSYVARVGFVTLLGLFAGIIIPLSDAIWWHHPLSFQLTQLAFHTVDWLLAGLVLGAVIKAPVRAG